MGIYYLIFVGVTVFSILEKLLPEGKMKKTEGYIVKELEDEYIVLPVGKRTEEVNEVISLSETAGFIYIHADKAEDYFRALMPKTLQFRPTL